MKIRSSPSYQTSLLIIFYLLLILSLKQVSSTSPQLLLSSKNYTNEEALKCFYEESLQGHLYYGANDENNPQNNLDPSTYSEECYDEVINNTTEWSDYYGNTCSDYNETSCESQSAQCAWDVGLPFVRPKRMSSEFLTCSAKVACCVCGGGYVVKGRYGDCVDREGLFGVEMGDGNWGSMWVDSIGRDCNWYSNTQEESNRCDKYGGYYSNMGYTANQACCTCGGGGYISDIMIMYSNKVLESYANGDKTKVERLLAEGILYTNLALKLSGSTLRIRTVLTAPDLSTFDPIKLFGHDKLLMNIVQLFLGYYDQGYYYNTTLGYEDLRKLYGADIFGYIFEEEISGSGYSERNYLPTQFWKRRSMLMVQRDQVTTNLTLAHEIAHIFGCNHDALADLTLEPFDGISYEFGYTNENNTDDQFHTIMSYGCMDPETNNTKRYVKGPNQACPRIPRYSNINYMYNNLLIGETHVNNVRMIERAAPCITKFYPSTSLTYCPQPSATVGDGICQNTNQNIHNCLWEGGDCCVETCIGPSCPTTNDNCKNPHLLTGTTIVNSFRGQCMDIDDTKVIVSDCKVDSSDQKSSQLWYYNRQYHTIHSKSLSNQYCLSYNTYNEIIMEYCDLIGIQKHQQWCFYQKSFSTRIIPFEYCSMVDDRRTYYGPSPSKNIFKETAKNVLMKDDKVILDVIHWTWDFSNSNWLLPDEFF